MINYINSIKYSSILLIILLFVFVNNSYGDIYLNSLKTEYMANPLGIDVAQPRFSWKLTSSERAQVQSAYRVLVASTIDNLNNNIGDIWDSGKVESDNAIQVVYSGSTLESKERYHWKVKVWGQNEKASDWSESAWFEMGLLSASDWSGSWIGASTGTKAPYFRKEFNINKTISRARLYICGLGYYEAFINGNRVGDNVLDPGFTKYDKTVLYVTHDVTSLLVSGANCIAIELGRGFYGITTYTRWLWHESVWNDNPKMILQLEIEFSDNTRTTIKSDSTYKATSGPRYQDCIYLGERYDARNEKPGWNNIGYNDSDWITSNNVEPPAGTLKGQMLPHIKIIETIFPQSITNSEPGIFVYDFEVVTAGWGKLTASAPAGTMIKIRHGEKLENGRVLSNYIGINDNDPDNQTDYYIFKGSGTETFESKFSYKGFRYIEIIDFPGDLTLDNLEAKVVHTAVESVGNFSCSNNLFNTLHDNVRRTILNNLHSIPTDTPIYEKNGWTADAACISESAIYNFDMAAFWLKWIKDFKDSQEDSSGQIPVINPTDKYGWVIAPDWTSAYIISAWNLYKYYGDDRIIEDQYESLKTYMEWDKNSTSTQYGDWMSPAGSRTESSVGARAFVCHELKLMENIANALGFNSDGSYWNNIGQQKKDSFNSDFLNEHIYAQDFDQNGYLQVNNILALAFDIVPEANKSSVIQNLMYDIKVTRNYHLWTGCLGTKYLWPVLTENGYGDLAYIVANKTDYPSYGQWINAGATTTWEAWGLDGRSRDHFFLGTIEQWFYEYLAGIKPDLPGFKTSIIKPFIIGDLTHASGTINTVCGTLSSNWTIIAKNEVTLNVEIPVNTTSKVFVPKYNLTEIKIKENGTLIWDNGIYIGGVNGVNYGHEETNYIVFYVGSGLYSFDINGTFNSAIPIIIPALLLFE